MTQRQVKYAAAIINDEYTFESVIAFKPDTRLLLKCKRRIDGKVVALKFCNDIEVKCELLVLTDIGGLHGIVEFYDLLDIAQIQHKILVLGYHNPEPFSPSSRLEFISFIKQAVKVKKNDEYYSHYRL